MTLIRTIQIRALMVPVLASVLLLSLLPTLPAEAQSQYHYDLTPNLEDKLGDYTWFVPPEDINNSGYEGDFNYTLAVGDSSDAELDNWAWWSFGSVAKGRYEVQAYIPRLWATAHPQYLIWADANGDGSFSNEFVAGPYLNQASGSGWRTVGEYDLSGDVRIEVRDVRSRDDYRTVGAASARLAVDAMRLKRVTQSFPPGRVELASVDYEVTNRSTGAGRVVWGAVQEATSYDLSVSFSVENINDGRTDEVSHELTDVACCRRSFSVSSGWRIVAYSMDVRAVNSNGAGLWLETEIIGGLNYPTPRPAAVTGLRYDRSAGRIVWQPAQAATAYDIEWKQPSSGISRTVALCSRSDGTLAGSSCVQPLTRVRHEQLEFRVRAKNQSGTQFGPWSSWITDRAETVRPVERPGSVSGVQFRSGRIVWNDAPRATAYDVDWRYPGETATRQSVNCSSNCSLGVSRDTTKRLEFRVRGKNGGGNGPWSLWANEDAEIQLPGAVTGLEYRSGRIVWSPASDAVAYDVEWRNGTGSVQRESVTCASSCSLEVERVAGTRLEFRVRGKNDAGRGQWTDWASASAQVTLPGSVRNLRLALTDHDSFRVTWDPPSSDGGSPIVRYVVSLSRPGWSAEYRKWTSGKVFNGRSGVTYTLRIRAQNGSGVGPSVTKTITTRHPDDASLPGSVRNLRLALTDHDSFRVTWDPPSSDGGSPIVRYVVSLSRPGWSAEYRKWTSGKVFNGRSGVTYTLRIRAQNGSGLGPSVTKTVRTPTPRQSNSTVPGKVRDLRLKLTDDDSFRVTWDPPSSDGGSPIVRYVVNLSQPGRTEEFHKWTSGKVYNGRRGTAYKLTIRAENTSGIGAGVTREIMTRGCIHSDKYRKKNIWNSLTHSRIVAQASIEWLSQSDRDWPEHKLERAYHEISRTDGVTDHWQRLAGYFVEKGAEGGKIRSGNSLSQSGCAWIGPDALVTDKARVSENALVIGHTEIRDRAKVYGSAVIDGEAEIKDDARVYGFAAVWDEAEVKDQAQVYGNARVFGDALIKGKAIVKGNAVISWGMQIDGGEYDGEQEYIRAAEELYKESFAAIVNVYMECDKWREPYGYTEAKQRAESYAKNLLAKIEVADAIGILNFCTGSKVIESIIDNFTGTDDALLSAASFALPILGSLKLGAAASNVVKLVSAGFDAYSTGSGAVWHQRTRDEYEKILALTR